MPARLEKYETARVEAETELEKKLSELRDQEKHERGKELEHFHEIERLKAIQKDEEAKIEELRAERTAEKEKVDKWKQEQLEKREQTLENIQREQEESDQEKLQEKLQEEAEKDHL